MRDPVTATILEVTPMDKFEQEFGSPNANAPRELSRFAFLIGDWLFDASVEISEGGSQTFHGTWRGRWILDGYAIADEYKMTDASGKLIVFGVNLRSYDSAARTWNLKWLNALTGRWLDLGPQELGGVRFESRSVSYVFQEPMAGHAYTRATYTSVSDDHFTWRGEKSDDRETWSAFMVIDVYRSEE